MSIVRSPRLADIRRREDEADRRKVRIIIGGLCFLAACAYVVAITIPVWK